MFTFCRTLIPLGLALWTSIALGSKDTYRIAVAGPHTGPYAAFGEQMLKGAKRPLPT